MKAQRSRMLLSPLRYPGGKAALVPYFSEFLESRFPQVELLSEPYAGGAGVGLGLLGIGRIQQLELVERDPLLYCLWKSILDHPEELAERVKASDVNLETWNLMQQFLLLGEPPEDRIIDAGFAALFLNRTNFSGILRAKPIGGLKQASGYKIDCRFYRTELARRILAIAASRDRISISFGDAIEHLEARKFFYCDSCLVYVDPPYLAKGRKLYRFSYGHKEHQELAKYLTQQSFHWVVSIDSTAEVKALYYQQRIVPVQLNYMVRKSRVAEELLISNCPLAPVREPPCSVSEDVADLRLSATATNLAALS